MEYGFSNAYEAVGWALRRVNTPVIDGPTVWDMGKKSSGREFMPDLDAWEKVAEAALILKNMERSCSRQQEAVILTYFTGGTVYETGVLVESIARQFGRDRWFVAEIVLHWAKGKKMLHTTEWWAAKYRVNQSTVTRWSQKIREKLDELLGSAMGVLHDALTESGHIGHA